MERESEDDVASGGSNAPQDKYIRLNDTGSRADFPMWNDTAPTASVFDDDPFQNTNPAGLSDTPSIVEDENDKGDSLYVSPTQTMKEEEPYIGYKPGPNTVTAQELSDINNNSIILYTIVDSGLAKFLANKSDEKKIPCFGVLGNLILSFSKLLNQNRCSRIQNTKASQIGSKCLYLLTTPCAPC